MNALTPRGRRSLHPSAKCTSCSGGRPPPGSAEMHPGTCWPRCFSEEWRWQADLELGSRLQNIILNVERRMQQEVQCRFTQPLRSVFSNTWKTQHSYSERLIIIKEENLIFSSSGVISHRCLTTEAQSSAKCLTFNLTNKQLLFFRRQRLSFRRPVHAIIARQQKRPITLHLSYGCL